MILSGTWEHCAEYTATMRKWRPAKSGRTSYGNIRLENPIQAEPPHHPQQNPAERRIGTIKDLTRRILDRSGAPAYLWYRAMVYAGGLLNVTAQQNLSWLAHPYRSRVQGDTRHFCLPPVHLLSASLVLGSHCIVSKKQGTSRALCWSR